MDDNDLQNSIEFRSQLDNLLNTSKKLKDFELTDLYDSKLQDNFENMLHNNESQIFLEKDFSMKKANNNKNAEKSELNILSPDFDNLLASNINNFDVESLEQILKTSYPNKKFNLNKSIEENSIQNSLALNQALLLLKSYDESKDNEDGGVNETYLNEIEKILDGIHSPDKKSPQKKRELEILIEMNNGQETEKKLETEKSNDLGEEIKRSREQTFEEKTHKTKNCTIF